MEAEGDVGTELGQLHALRRRCPWLFQSHRVYSPKLRTRLSVVGKAGLYLTKVKQVELFHSLFVLPASVKRTQAF